jgi:diacylglycerol kinase family enzyme
MRSALLIANPNAQRVTPARRDLIARTLRERFDVELAETKAPGHGSQIAEEAVLDGASVLITFGGDGTINEVANGLAGVRSHVPMAILPGGGTNVLARSLGIPTDAMAATRSLIRRSAFAPRRMPLGRIDERYFAANCGVGLDAAIVREVERRQRLKHLLGEWSFVANGVRQFFAAYDRRTPHLTISWGEELERHRAGQYLAIVQNASPFTFLGRRALRICPEVRLGDGLDCFGVDSMRTDIIIPILFSAFGAARHVRDPHATYLRSQARLAIRTDVPMPVQADGEYIGQRWNVMIEFVPDALSIL